MPKLNWEIILSNIKEAREQLEEIENLIAQNKTMSEIELQIQLEHAYHHLNFAWNIRCKSSKNYAKLSDDEFNEWSKFPKEIHISKLVRPKQKSNAQRSADGRTGND